MIMLRHPATGITKGCPQGYSFTLLFFGVLVPLFRGDLKHAAILFCLAFFAGIIFPPLAVVICAVYAAVYNGMYQESLLERGYKIVGDESPAVTNSA